MADLKFIIPDSNFFTEIDTLQNNEDANETVLNRPIIQVAINTGWLKTHLLSLQGVVSGKQDKITQKSAFNKDFGTLPGTVTEGNDPRLSNARPPTMHTHPVNQISFEGITGHPYVNNGVLTWLNTVAQAVDWNSINSKPVLFNSSIPLVENLGIELANKSNIGHFHSISEVYGLEDALTSKAEYFHTHSMQDVFGLNLVLAEKAEAYHTHELDEVNGLIDELNARAGNLHSHFANDISDGINFTKRIQVELESSMVFNSYYKIPLQNSSKVYQVTRNGLDLWDSEFVQSGSNLYLENSSVGDKVVVYSNVASQVPDRGDPPFPTTTEATTTVVSTSTTVSESTTEAPTTTEATTTGDSSTTTVEATTEAPTTTEATTTEVTTTESETTTEAPTTTEVTTTGQSTTEPSETTTEPTTTEETTTEVPESTTTTEP